MSLENEEIRKSGKKDVKLEEEEEGEEEKEEEETSIKLHL